MNNSPSTPIKTFLVPVKEHRMSIFNSVLVVKAASESEAIDKAYTGDFETVYSGEKVIDELADSAYTLDDSRTIDEIV